VGKRGKKLEMVVIGRPAVGGGGAEMPRWCGGGGGDDRWRWDLDIRGFGWWDLRE
jgi:hypothetical protein